MVSTESPVSSKRLLALTKVKILTQTSSELVQLDQQIATEHLFGKICLPMQYTYCAYRSS